MYHLRTDTNHIGLMTGCFCLIMLVASCRSTPPYRQEHLILLEEIGVSTDCTEEYCWQSIEIGQSLPPKFLDLVEKESYKGHTGFEIIGWEDLEYNIDIELVIEKNIVLALIVTPHHPLDRSNDLTLDEVIAVAGLPTSYEALLFAFANVSAKIHYSIIYEEHGLAFQASEILFKKQTTEALAQNHIVIPKEVSITKLILFNDDTLPMLRERLSLLGIGQLTEEWPLDRHITVFVVPER